MAHHIHDHHKDVHGGPLRAAVFGASERRLEQRVRCSVEPRAIDVTHPLGLEPANWPPSQTGIGSHPYALDTWQSFWAADAVAAGR